MPVDVSDNVDTIEIPFVYSGLMFLHGHLPSVLSGYLAATFAGRNFLFHAVIVGTVLLAFYGAFWLIPSNEQFSLVQGIILLLTIPLAAIGGVVRAWQEK